MNSKEIYDLCIENAIKSPCQKRGFGCILMVGGEIVSYTLNKPISPAKFLCEGKCIRFGINSGTDSLVGSCGHAEELAVWEGIRKMGGLFDKMAMIYVAGVIKPDNTPYQKTDPYFYCIRCATLMHYAGIFGINVWFDSKWNFLTTEEAYKSSIEFALGRRIA